MSDIYELNKSAIVEHILDAFEIENLPDGLEQKISAQVEHIISETNRETTNIYADIITTALGRAEQITRGRE